MHFLCYIAAPWRTVQNLDVRNHNDSPAGSSGLCNNAWCLTPALKKCQRPAWRSGNLTINITGSWLYTAAWDAAMLQCCLVMTGALVCYPLRGKQCPPACCGIWPFLFILPHSVTTAGSVPKLKMLKTGAIETFGLFLNSACTAILMVPLLTIHNNWVPKYFTPW